MHNTYRVRIGQPMPAATVAAVYAAAGVGLSTLNQAKLGQAHYLNLDALGFFDVVAVPPADRLAVACDLFGGWVGALSLWPDLLSLVAVTTPCNQMDRGR
ncbi:hypothetical protein [Aeoliella mucimassa]|uniref:Uncharacterized protein n=1 Tax=Aeoliella mucimassa TaxID=2527972 RepID=A0A518AT63_9BACT|nr:hypothetical protein [Aeoliella mucimassa]QDU57934.1 hypothetical protein Pan181_41570 [Aeoliella mucimassa]